MTVRPAPEVPHHDDASASPRIVCGVNGSSSSRRALAEALRRAAATGEGVTVVTAYDAAGYVWGALASLPGGNLLPVPDRPEVQRAEEATLREFVGHVLADRRAVPAEVALSVPVGIRAVPGHPVDVLVRESAGAAALVVGHGEESGPLTSVAVGCSRRAHCPVVVVEPDRQVTPRHLTPRRAEPGSPRPARETP